MSYVRGGGRAARKFSTVFWRPESGQRIVDLEYGPGVVVARDAAPNWVMLTFDQEKQVMFRAHVSRLRAERVALRVIPGGKADLQKAAAAA